MDYRNENMEEFFRNSLDKFNEDPSEHVWQDLDHRLDQDKSKGFFGNWLKYLLPVLLALITFSAFSLYQMKILESYKKELSLIQDENKNLKVELASKQKSKTKLESIEASPIISYTEKKTNQIVYLRDTVFIIKQPSTNTPIIPSSVINLPSFDFKTPGLRNYMFNSVQPSKFGGHRTVVGHPSILNEKDSDLKQEGYVSEVNAQYRVPRYGLGVSSLYPALTFDSALSKMKYRASNHSKRKKKKYKPIQPPIIIVKDDVLGQPQFYYKAGISFNILNSLKGEQFSNSSIGFGYGLVQEVGLSTRFSITSGIMQTTQEYALNNGTVPLDQALVGSFPDQANFRDNIVRVEVENRFLEIPLGFKYDWYQDNLKSFFINPAIKWSIHDPQQFNYFLTEDRIRFISTNQRFGYLNAIHLSMGIEKIVNPWMSYQVSLGYDFNIEPIGLEKQKLNSLYLKCNVLFGKK